MMDTRIFLHLDCETRSSLDLKKVGLQRYAENAEMLMLAWAINHSDVKLWIPSEGPIPEDLELYLRRKEIVKTSWQSPFEQAILKYACGIDVPTEQWIDTAAMSRFGSCPSNLNDACRVFRLPVDKAKDKEGKKLIQKFCNSTKRGYKTPAQAPEDFRKFGEYCKQDVIAERELFHKMLPLFALPEREQKLWLLDQKINMRGMPVDRQFVLGAVAFTERVREGILNRMKERTGLENPNSNVQMLRWLKQQGYPYKSLGKAFVLKALANPVMDAAAQETLELRLQYNKASIKKLYALQERMLADGWIRRNYKYYGAHTGRWSGEGVQLQNLPRPIKSLEKEEAYVAAVDAIRNYEVRPSA